jgi:phospholipid transport system substrate-binding protein
MKVAMLISIAVLTIDSGAPQASPSDPALIDVQTLNDSLLRAMHAGPLASSARRYHELEPVIERVFALPLMARLSVGPDWSKFAPGQQRSLIGAFSRYTVANYAHNFREFDGQRFEVGESVIDRGTDKIVRSRLISRGDSAANLLYRLVSVDGVWKIVDVYYNGVSQLTLHRVDFASAIAAGGANALIAHLNQVSNDLLR